MYPLNPTAIPESAFAPLLTTERPDAGQIDQNNANNVNDIQLNNINDQPNNVNNVQYNDPDSDDSADNIPLSMLKNIIQQKVPDTIKNSFETPVKVNDTTQAEAESECLDKSFKDLLPTPELF